MICTAGNRQRDLARSLTVSSMPAYGIVRGKAPSIAEYRPKRNGFDRIVFSVACKCLSALTVFDILKPSPRCCCAAISYDVRSEAILLGHLD